MTSKYVYIMGSSSGVGKTMLCEGLLSQLLDNGYQPERLAYIKPMTQCIDKQAVTEFCERENISHRSIASLVFKQGFTKDFIAGLTKDTASLLEDILSEIKQISENKEVVVIDAIGGVSTGSVVGISNVEIASLLAAQVLFVGKNGIGSSIDDTILAISFMQQHGIHNIALLYNKIKPSERVNVKHYVSKRLAELLPSIPILDFIADYPQLNSQTKHMSATAVYQWFSAQKFN